MAKATKTPQNITGRYCHSRTFGRTWACRFVVPGEPRCTAAIPGATTKEEAEAFAGALRQKKLLVARGTITAEEAKETCTLDFALAEYWERVAKDFAGSATFWGFSKLWKQTLGRGGRTVDQITRVDIVNHRDTRRAEGLSDGTIVNELSFLKRVLHAARYDWGYRTSDIDWSKLGLKRRKKRNVAHFSPGRINKVIEDSFARDPDFFFPLHFTFCHARRRGNVIGLKWTEIVWDLGQHGSVKQIGKGGKLLHFELTAESAAIIRSQEGLHPVYVFTWRPKVTRADLGLKIGERQPWSKTSFRWRWEAVRAALALDGIRFHDIRHIVGTLLLRLTGDITVVQAGLDHSDPSQTNGYIDADVSRATGGFEALETARRVAAIPAPKPPTLDQRIAALEAELADLYAQRDSAGNVVQLPRRQAS